MPEQVISNPNPLSPAETSPLEQKKSPLKVIAVIIVVLLLLAGGAYAFNKYYQNKNIIKPKPVVEGTITPLPSPPEITAGKFARYQEMAASFTPKTVQPQVSQDFSNVENFKDFEWIDKDATNKEKFLKNNFLVLSGWGDEFFPLYESNRYGFTPNFITTDSIIHSYHLLFNYLLEKLEKNKLDQINKDLTMKMVKISQDYYEQLKGTSFELAAKRNIAFFSVVAKLLDDSFAVPDLVKESVAIEMKLISEHKDMAISPVINLGTPGAGQIIDPSSWPTDVQAKALKEDYTQYIPRGHYDKTEQLQKYFKAMMWYGRMTFRFKEDDEIKSAMLINFALRSDQEALSKWQTIDEIIKFFVGKSDDIDYYAFDGEMSKAYGGINDVKGLIDESKFGSLKTKLASLSPPAINSIPIYMASIQPDRGKEIKGFRFMGQKFTVDASIFQRLITREVGPKGGSCKPPFDDGRMLPKGLDIPAAMGSSEALDILKTQGDTQHACYPENMAALKTYIDAVSIPVWTQNLYWGWMYSLRPLTEKRGEGYPLFMQSSAWLRKQLNAFLGSWTELKHDTILYAKQVYAEMGGGPPEEKDDRGYVEPEPVFYARLAALTKMTNEGLSSRGLSDQSDKDILKIMEELCVSLKTISEKELQMQSLTKEEYELIRGYGGSLEHLYTKAMEDVCKDKNARLCLDDNPAALVADVATDPNGQVLEEATGKIDTIYVIVPVEGKLRIAKGGVFSYYEFPWPMTDRLTDTKWREILNGDKDIPSLPSWAESYRGKQQ